MSKDSISLFDRIRLSSYLFVLALIAFFGAPDDLKVPAVCYFGAIDVFLYGNAGLGRVDSVFSRWSREVRAEKARPNRSLMEFEGGERP